MAPPVRATVFLACASALIVGGFISLFTAGPALFTDGPFEQRLPVLAYSVVGFVLLGAVIGFSAPGAWKPAAICIALSAIPVVMLFGRASAGQLPMALLSTGFITGDAAAGAFGVWGGARLRLELSARRARLAVVDDAEPRS